MSLSPAFSPNLLAFLGMITWSELGTGIVAGSDQGFNVLVGSRPENILTFSSYKDHPRALISIRNSQGRTIVTSTAAGAFQILEHYYDAYKLSLGLSDFSPLSQRLIAIQMIRECKALEAIEAGKISQAISLCASRWASLPGAGYGQHENPASTLIAIYCGNGGTLS